MSDAIERLNEALTGRYEVERELGQGGMATVYLARDEKHNRNVALKVLRPELAAVLGAERFLAEIETTANLQHPHILPLFDSGAEGEFLFYVMPYIEGETLREKIDREKQLGVDEALGIATAVANALQVAHEAGIVHRDIKPGNILLSRGEPLVADFGIALAVGAAGGSRLTETGLSVGTPYYMSPEQATGDQGLGPASDIYALACVLYEMLVGEPPYLGNTAQAVLGRIIQGAPPSATSIRASIPANVDAAIRRALEKIPADRFTSAREFASALADKNFRHGEEDVAVATAPTGRDRVAARASMAAAAVFAGLAAWAWFGPSPAPTPTRGSIDLGELSFGSVANEVLVSPDGTRFAVVAEDSDGTTAIYVRTAGEADFQLVPGTEDAAEAAFSPDSEWIVYSVGRERLMKVYLLGGAPTVVPTGDAANVQLPSWSDDQTIVFGGRGGVYRVPDSGGEPEQLLALEAGVGMLGPVALPGGAHVLGTRFDQGTRGSIEAIDVETGETKLIKTGATDPRYVARTGHLLYSDVAGVLWAAPFDPEKAEITGQERPVVEGVSMPIGPLFARYSVSETGTLVYSLGPVTGGGFGVGDMTLVQVSLGGASTAESLDPRVFNNPRWSPDGRYIAYSGGTPGDAVGGRGRGGRGGVLGGQNVFTYDAVQRSQPRQLTTEGNNTFPVWSPDGSRIVFLSNREGTQGGDLFVREVAGTAEPTPLLSLPGRQFPMEWPEENTIFFSSDGDLWIADLTAWPESDSVAITPYFESESNLGRMRLSPQGDLVAYDSNETERLEVYVKAYPEPLAPERVSEGGGQYPQWSPDGGTIYYWRSGQVYAAEIQREPTFAVLERTLLFGWSNPILDLHPDGGRFVGWSRGQAATEVTDEPVLERHFVIVNWFEELKQRMGN